jgi:hypothetical protein
MRASGWDNVYEDGPVCLQVVSVVSAARRTIDVDNIVKGLLDAMQGVLYADDSQVQCLTSRRMTYDGPTGYYLLRANAVHPFGADVVCDDGKPPIILSGQRIEVATG